MSLKVLKGIHFVVNSIWGSISRQHDNSYSQCSSIINVPSPKTGAYAAVMLFALQEWIIKLFDVFWCFTCVAVTGQYALVEGSRGEFFSDAKLQSPKLPASSNVCFFSFVYNLNGKRSGFIRLTATVSVVNDAHTLCRRRNLHLFWLSIRGAFA